MIKFKDTKLEREYNELPVHNARLYKLLSALNAFCELELSKDIVITHLYRTQAEHDSLYAKTPPAQRPGRSPHQDWNAVDLRSSVFNDAEIKRMLSFLNCFTYRAGKPVAMYHAIAGNVFHYHIQFEKEKK